MECKRCVRTRQKEIKNSNLFFYIWYSIESSHVMFDNVLLLIWGRATGPCTAEFIRIYNSSKVHWITNLNLRWSSTRLGIAWSLCSPRQTCWTHYGGFHLIFNLVLDCWRVHGLIGSVMTYPARVPYSCDSTFVSRSLRVASERLAS